jgi:nitrate reductase (NAD(P)H)
MMRKHLPNPSEDSVILLCGPDGLIEKTVKPGLKELGFDLETAVHCF